MWLFTQKIERALLFFEFVYIINALCRQHSGCLHWCPHSLLSRCWCNLQKFNGQWY